MNFGVIEDCNFIMSYCELVNKIKAEPLKYIDEYNLLYLRNYLDGYYYFKKYNGFFDDLLIFGDYCFNYFIQNKVMKIENSLAKKIDCLGSRNWESYIPLVETDPEKQFDFFFECFDEFKTLALADYDFTPLVRRFDKCDRDTYKLSLIKIKETNIKTDFLQFITILRGRVCVYIGYYNLKYLKYCINGFIYASKELGVIDNFASFYEQKFNSFFKKEVLKNQNINIESEIDYTKIIPLFVTDLKKQIKTYLMYFDKFVSLYNK